MKVLIAELESWEKPVFGRLAEYHEVVSIEGRLTSENAAEYRDAEIISPFIYSQLNAETMKQFPNLKYVTTRSTGVDHIDLDYCKEKNILVSNVPTYGENTVAEHVFALLMTISHRMWDAIDRTRKGDFSFQGLRGFDLQGKTLGLIGTGSIGRNVIRIARGFDMRVIAHDIQENKADAERLGFEYRSLDDVLREADIVSLHVPGTPKTRNMIADREFSLMKQGVVIINTARGQTIDIKAMIRALANGKVAAAGLDVLPDEPTIREEAELLRRVFHERHDQETLLADHVLLRLRNVFITPHNAFNTKEAVHKILETTIANIRAFRLGSPINLMSA